MADLFNDLKSQLAAGQVVAIVGAGVAMGAADHSPVASWIGLLEHGIERCLQVAIPPVDAAWADLRRAQLKAGHTNELIFVAEEVTEKLGGGRGGEFRKWLRETVGSLEVKQPEVLEALRDLGVPIAT